MNGVWRAGNGVLSIFLRVTPNASRNELKGLWTGPDGKERITVRVTAPPEKGRANKAVIALFSKAIGAPKSAFAIVSGETDRLKTLEIAGDPATMITRLQSVAEF